MNRNRDIAKLIEKNRIALMRLVGCWLLMCMLVPADRIIPKRLRRFIVVQIVKAETAAECLVIALARLVAGRGTPIDIALPANAAFALTLDAKTVRARLLRLQHKLFNLRAFALRLAAKTRRDQFRFKNNRNAKNSADRKKSNLTALSSSNCWQREMRAVHLQPP